MTDTLLDFVDKQVLVRRFLAVLAETVAKDERLDDDLRHLLLKHSSLPFTPMTVFSEISPDVLLHLAQKTADTMNLQVKMTFQDFSHCHFFGDYAERCYASAYGEYWFEKAPYMGLIRKPLKLRFTRMLYKHSVSNWEQFDPFSVNNES